MKTITERTAGHPSDVRPSRLNPAAAPTRRLILALGAVLCAGTPALHAQTWETVLDVPTVGWAKGSTADAAGNIFVSGLMRDTFSGPWYAVIMKSSDGGQSWDSDPSTPEVDDPSDVFTTANGKPTYDGIASARVSDGAGGFVDHIVAVGAGSRPVTNQLGAFNSNVFIRRSLDSGATWQTLDEYEHPTYENLSGPRMVAVDHHGNIYSVIEALEHKVVTKGKSTTTTRIEHWLVRKGTNRADGTMTWETIDLPFPDTLSSVYGNLWARGIACAGDDVFIVGEGGIAGNDWEVIKGSNGGASWVTVDRYRLDTSGISQAYAIAADGAGNLYVAGTGEKTVTIGKGKTATRTTTRSWIVRKGTPGGTSWETVDSFEFPGGYATPTAVAVDSLNRVHVNGSAKAGTLPTQWITRQGTGGSWATTDLLTYSADGGTTFGESICADPTGNVFAVGGSSDPSNGNPRNWIVRRSLAP